jgi:Delta7-sterol 5-desaturase
MTVDSSAMDAPQFAPLLTYQGQFLVPALLLGGLFAVRYLVLAGLAFAFWYGPWRMRVRAAKLQPATPSWSQIAREIGWSAIAVLVFGGITGLISAAGLVPRTRLYPEIAQFGWVYFGLSIPVMLVLHDTWFYWTHRLMHHPALFRHVHRVHHLSTNPTPWTAYSFHPVESIVQGLGVVAIVFVVPVHPLAVVVFQTLSTAVNVYGHSGYELYPRGWATHRFGRWLNTSVAHNAHHATARHNYGLYFLAWDRWMGTIDMAYAARYAQARPPVAPA